MKLQLTIMLVLVTIMAFGWGVVAYHEQSVIDGVIAGFFAGNIFHFYMMMRNC